MDCTRVYRHLHISVLLDQMGREYLNDVNLSYKPLDIVEHYEYNVSRRYRFASKC